jgi:hypothetical protein
MCSDWVISNLCLFVLSRIFMDDANILFYEEAQFAGFNDVLYTVMMQAMLFKIVEVIL